MRRIASALIGLLLASVALADVTGPSTPAGGGQPSGAAGGDLSGTYPNPTVVTAGGQPILTTTNSASVSNKDVSSPTNNLGLAPINLQRYGACGITDATTIWNTAEALAESSGRPLYLPGGCTVNHSGTLLLEGTQLYGDGLGSILNATDTQATPFSALQFHGTGVIISGINFKTAWTGTRSNQVYSSAISIPYPPAGTVANFKILNNYFSSRFAGADIEESYIGSYGEIAFNQLTSGAYANAMIIQGPADHIDIHDNLISGTSGDTCIEMSDNHALTTSGLVYVSAHHNQVSDCTGHGISVVGGRNVTIDDNKITNVGLRGIYIANETGFAAVQGVTASNNVITNAGTITPDYYIMIRGQAGFPVVDVSLLHNTLNVTTAVSAGILVGLCSCSSADIRNDRINVSKNMLIGDGVNPADAIAVRGANDVTIEGNSASGFLQRAINNVAGNSGYEKILGNEFRNLSLQTTATYPAILDNNSGFTSIVVSGNSYLAGANAISNFMTCSATTTPVWFGPNLSADKSTSGCLVSQTAFNPFFTIPASGTYTAKNFDDLAYNNGVGNLLLTFPAAVLGATFRLSDRNKGAAAPITLVMAGSDTASFPLQQAAGQTCTYVSPAAGQWNSTCYVGPDYVRVVITAGAITVVGSSVSAPTDRHICVNKTSGAATAVNLPATPYTGLSLTVDDCKGDAATNNITVTPAAGNIDGAGTFVINTNFGSWTGYYTGTIWKTTASR